MLKYAAGRNPALEVMEIMKKVLIVFPTEWDTRQLESCRDAWADQYELIFEGPEDSEVPASFDALQFIEEMAAQYRGRIDGVLSSSDYPGATAAGAIATHLGLPGTPPERLLRCSHKYYSRIGHQEVVPEATPWFQLVDPDRPGDAAARLQFPCFLKPVRGAFSIMSRRVDSAEELVAFLSSDAVRWFLTDYVRIFNRLVRKFTDLPFDGSYFIAEELLSGMQATVEGYVCDGEVVTLGTVDSVMHPHSHSFARFDYPSTLRDEIQHRMCDIAARLVRHMGLDHCLFNIEMMYEPVRDRISIIEVNPRICGQFADLYAKVQGVNSYAIALALATGMPYPRQLPRGHCAAASSFPLRVFSPLRVTRAPSDDDLRAAQAMFPGTLVWSECAAGDNLNRFEDEDGASQRYAVVNLGADDRTQLLEHFDAVRARLGYEFEPV